MNTPNIPDRAPAQQGPARSWDYLFTDLYDSPIGPRQAPQDDLFAELFDSGFGRRQAPPDGVVVMLETEFGFGTAAFFDLAIRLGAPGEALARTLIEPAAARVKSEASGSNAVAAPDQRRIIELDRVFLRRASTLDLDVGWLAEGLSRRWNPGGHGRLAGQRRITARASENGRAYDEERIDLCRIGLLLAARDIERPQTIRLGSGWVVGVDGHKIGVEPSRLRPPAAIRWFAKAAKSAAQATLWDEPWPAKSKDALHPERRRRPDHEVVPFDEAVALRDAIGSDEDSLAAALRLTEACGADASLLEVPPPDVLEASSAADINLLLEELRDLASPRQAEVLTAVIEAYRAGATNITDARFRAAQSLGMKVSTLKTNWNRFVDKARARSDLRSEWTSVSMM